MNPDVLELHQPLKSATVTAPAKLNLSLHVLGRQPDGFHEISSLVIGVGLFDRMRCDLLSAGSAAEQQQSSASGIALTCNDPALCHADNLAYRAAGELGAHLGGAPSVRIQLDKQIPIGGGLGGGSSDAAAVLRTCNALWDARLTEAELAAIGARIGSDVPLFFHLPVAKISGRGERVERAAMRWSGWVLLVSVRSVVSTAKVYQAWRRGDGGNGAGGSIEALLRAATAEEFSGGLFNALQPAVFRVAPDVKRVYEELHESGLGPMHVTGAGSTMYRLFDDRRAAWEAARRAEAMGLPVTTNVVAAPVGPGRINCEG